MTAPWLVAWAVARTRNKSTPVSSHGNVGPMHWEWLRWAQWKLVGAARDKRPANVRARIPRSWYPPCKRFIAEMRGSTDNPNGGRIIPLSEYREHTAPTAWPYVGVYTAEDVQDWAQLL